MGIVDITYGFQYHSLCFVRSNKLWILDFGLRIADCGLWIMVTLVG